jgi:predicted Zn-dependent peptidase
VLSKKQTHKTRDRTSLYGYYHSQLGDLTPALNYPARIQAVKAYDIQQAAQDYLATDAYGMYPLHKTLPRLDYKR